MATPHLPQTPLGDAASDVPAIETDVPGPVADVRDDPRTEPVAVAPQDPTRALPPSLSGRARLRELASARLPAGSTGRLVAKAALSSYRETVAYGRALRSHAVIPGLLEGREPSYRGWSRSHAASPTELRDQHEDALTTRSPHRVLVLVAAGSGAVGADVDRSVQSLVDQSWPHWRAVVVADASSVRAGGGDVRVAVSQVVGIAAGASAAVEAADEDFVVVLPAGDQLAPDCFWQVMTHARQDPLLDLISWDDDVQGPRGANVDPRFRPGWSPDALLGSNYLGHSVALRRRRWIVGGGLASGTPWHVALWDLLLRCDLSDERTSRVTRVLGHVRVRREGVDRAGAAVVRAHLERTGRSADVEVHADSLRVRWTREVWPSVSVVIPTRHNRANLSRCLPSLARTDYPADVDVRVIDNGGESEANERWYRENSAGLDLSVTWWHEHPFNYSRVNNVAARQTAGDVVVFLNDDTEVLDPSWLRELVGWADQPGAGCVGLHLTGPDGEVQFAGTVLGLGGFADHVFQGMDPHGDSLLGPVARYRDVLAVTGACLAVRRSVFEQIGGMDERFVLCGSDVAMGLDARLAGLRNVCSPYAGLRHLESATRGTSVPPEDFFTSYWKYSTWILGGDPYFSPNVSLGSREPRLRRPDEPTPQSRLAPAIGRNLTVFRQKNDAVESRMLAEQCRVGSADVERVHALHAENSEPFDVRTINWYIPDIDSPFYGGINTALRMADYLAREHGVENRFVVWGSPPDSFTRSALAAAFPSLAACDIHFYDGGLEESLAGVPPCDVAIATLWVTAYAVAKAPGSRRKMYLVQDFEPMFYPASTLYALTEETYRLGLYALCNTENLLKISTEDYGGQGFAFTPAVLPSVFHAEGRAERGPDDPVTVFVYARPGHWRNCWELAAPALEEIKDRFGDRVRIVTAGSWAEGAARTGTLGSLGLLTYEATGDLYRRCDVGLALTVSKHPSYLPLELMACGVPVVAFDNPWGHWILRDGENSLLARRTVTGLVEQLERLVGDAELRRRLASNALQDIAARHSDWDAAFSGIHGYLCDPQGRRRS